MEKVTLAGPSTGDNATSTPDKAFDITTFFPALQAALAQPTQHVNDFPEGDDLKLHRTMDRKLAKRLDATTSRVLGLASRLVDFVARDSQDSAVASGTRNSESSAPAFASVGIKKRKRLQEEDDAIHEFENQIVEVLDSLLERADTNLDIVTGKRKVTEISAQAEATLAARQKFQDTKRENQVTALPDHILNADIPKPQEKFDPAINNSNDLPPWTPTLAVKHHAMVPLDYIPTPSSSRPASPGIEASGSSLTLPSSNSGLTVPSASAPVGIAEVRGVTVRHPYMYETKHLGYPSSLFTITPPTPPRSFADTPFTWVDQPEQLEQMVEKLKLAKELAVDLEYHSTRSFTGFLCLMQISTREEDFVVDVIRLRKEVWEGKLGGVLADPSIIKVFHGAESDILWLQQDFDLYVVGLFDTYHATKVLHYPQHSLASLLTLFCDFTADKRYQVADWRIRPVPAEMLHYARSDTHFLLYVYDQLRNSLLERAQGKQDLVRQVLKRSEDTALKLYTRIHYDAEKGFGMHGWRAMLKRQMGHKGSMTMMPEYGNSDDIGIWGIGELAKKKERVFKRLHAWRDAVSREEDESPFYVMPNGMLWSIVQRLPQSEDGLLRTVDYSKSGIPARRKDELLKVILDACREGSEAYAAAVQAKKAASGAGLLPDEESVERMISMDLDISKNSDHTFNATALQPSTSIWSSRATSNGNNVPSSLLGNTLTRSSSLPQIGDESSQLPGNDEERLAKLRRILQDFSVRQSDATVNTEDIASAEDILRKGETGAVEEMEVDSTPIIPEQVPYVPPEDRSTKPRAVKERNAIVQVAKASGSSKKRKSQVDAKAESTPEVAEVQSVDSGSPAPPTKKTKRAPVKAEDIPEFDYSQEPNQLDTFEPSSTARERRKKPKKARQPIVDLSNFRKPPMDPANVASGNKSRTF
ncbi:hypothetical protein QFC22_000205 [Naganishia vaughanmartiniae]|uniref:Uncharacterized protein n=1 Tax=Naganishia vaughanmartiniae TaxID=1424756 RepID=A0ACC2XPF2_9TREE|nr:hypothetical protein QFC22_000205 [Naganishia vaughanmartiniae]